MFCAAKRSESTSCLLQVVPLCYRKKMTTNFAILRVQKIKSSASLRRSFNHAFREQETPNADPEKLALNSHFGAESAAECMAKTRDLLPEKRRKDAVLTLEYLITASPEALKAKTPEEQDAYFADALDWLKAKHGADNVVFAGIHRDEKTPHMYAYAVPLTPDGRLSARDFVGSAKALSTMQSEFVDRVGLKHGLERGLEGSRAKHEKVMDWYGKIEKELPEAVTISSKAVEPRVLEQKTFSKVVETPEQVAERVTKAVREVVEPLRVKAQAWDSMQAQAKEQTRAAVDLRAKLGGFYKAFMDGLKPDQKQTLVESVRDMRDENAKTAEAERVETERQRRVDALATLVKTRAGAVLTFAQNALEAIKAKAGQWRSVDWENVEKRSVVEATQKNGQSFKSSVEAVFRHSPRHAGLAEETIQKVLANAAAKDRELRPGVERENDNDLGR